MHSDISDEELDAFLKEAGIVTTPLNTGPRNQTESLETILDEIIGPVRTNPDAASPPVEEKIPTFLFGTETPKRRKFPFFPLGVSIAFLGGIFIGIVFGFYWCKSTTSAQPLTSSFETIDAKLTQLVDEIHAIYDTITPKTAPEEIIEPIEPLDFFDSEAIL